MEEEILMNKKRFLAFNSSNLKEALKSIGISVDINNGKVIIRGDAVNVMLAKEVITAFNRGFDEDASKLLLNEDYFLEIILLDSYTKNKKRMIKLKGRIIGRDGSIKAKIERTTNTKISVFGKTISIIGKYDEVDKAKRIINKILSGKSLSIAFGSINYG
ncbi:MAG: KH domain-containing protein [Candidatus Parvarchaeota archaeon]|nr:KH domain-containing protein [Candidatus Rehaiarchaeum fermentans]MCW1293423.1 KH domain-containing protein [Candidatus Rehaiarchaeum fermentans]